jgi:hypothetical protein
VRELHVLDARRLSIALSDYNRCRPVSVTINIERTVRPGFEQSRSLAEQPERARHRDPSCLV